MVALLANLFPFPGNLYRGRYIRRVVVEVFLLYPSRLYLSLILSVVSLTFRLNRSTQLSSLPMFNRLYLSPSSLLLAFLIILLVFLFFATRDSCPHWTHVFAGRITCFFLDEGTEGRRWTRPLLTSLRTLYMITRFSPHARGALINAA